MSVCLFHCDDDVSSCVDVIDLRLVALSTQLQAEQDKYMRTIRVSLRDFRKRLDDTLQMLRQSNAKFIRSFKIFSDGGNFCPEEIDDFRKKLDKMSQKIDSTEGSVMSDLEGIESKRLDQATKIANEFEDRCACYASSDAQLLLLLLHS